MDSSVSDLIVEQSPDALVVLDAADTVMSWNRAAERIFGTVAGDAIGRPLGELVIEVADLESRNEGEVSHHELICRRADGSLIYVRRTMRAQYDADGRLLRQFCNLSDVTAIRSERDREFVRARYQGLLESVPDAVVIVNDSGRIVLFNAQAVALFGHTSDDVIGRPMEVLLPERLRAQHVPQRASYLSSPRRRPMGRGLALHGLHADGSEFPVEISLSPIDVEGRHLVMSAIRDISDRKRIEQALQEQNLALERANRAKDHFLATMSHELRTPLNAILGFTGLLLMKLAGPLTEQQQRQLQHVQTSGKHLLSLINDLLDLAKIESGKVELVCEPVDARPVVDEVVVALRPAAHAKQLALQVELPAHELMVMADRRALHQVLLNLASNAVKFTPHGEVVIRARAAEGRAGPGLSFEVADTGIGISAKDQQLLFGPFVQVGQRRVGAQEGTGLGLHLSRKLAELMGGQLVVQSEIGVGSRFTLTLGRPPLGPVSALGGHA